MRREAEEVRIHQNASSNPEMTETTGEITKTTPRIAVSTNQPATWRRPGSDEMLSDLLTPHIAFSIFLSSLKYCNIMIKKIISGIEHLKNIEHIPHIVLDMGRLLPDILAHEHRHRWC